MNEAHDGPHAGAETHDEEIDHVGVLPQLRRSTRWSRIWRPFWVLPAVIVVAAAALGALLPEWEQSLGGDLPHVFQGGADGARSMLSTIAGAMISVTGLVFTITMVVVQLASSQFSPRLLGDFLSSRVTQTTIGVFAATFVYALTVLRAVQGVSGEASFVPQVAITVGFGLVLASVGTFLLFIQHITTSIQVSSIVSRLGDRATAVSDKYFPAADSPRARRTDEGWTPAESASLLVLTCRQHGYVVEVGHRTLVEWAENHGAVVEVLAPVGRYVTEGTPVLHIWGLPLPEQQITLSEHQEDKEWASALDLDVVGRMIVVEQYRAFHQDPAFGVRKLVDIAERALSPAINDPTTASQVADELHRVLRLLVTRRDLPSVVWHGGAVRLVHRPQHIAELIDLALEELLHYAEGSVQIPRQVLFIIDQLRPVAVPTHVPVLDHWAAVAGRIVAPARHTLEL